MTFASTPWEAHPVGLVKEELMVYRFLIPLLAVCNLALGVLTLGGLGWRGWLGALELATGTVCCFLAGALIAAVVSKSYWTRAMRNQVMVWRQVGDALIRWMEQTRTSDDALVSLQSSLRKILVETRARGA